MTTALSAAILSRDIDAIRASLIAGEDANQAFSHHDSESVYYDNGDMSPSLIWATKLRLPEAIKLLLEAGANPDGQDRSGRNALAILCSWTAEWQKTAEHDKVSPNVHRAEVIQLLKKYNCNPNLLDNKDNNALHISMGNCCFCYGERDIETGKYAPDEESFKWLKALLDTGIDQFAKNSEGKIPILCLYDLSPYYIKRLHEVGMCLDMPTADGNLINSLMKVYSWMTRGGEGGHLTEVIEYLLQTGLDPNSPNEYGARLIDYVEDSKLVLALINHGAYGSDKSLKYKFEVCSAEVIYADYLEANASQKDTSAIQKALEHVLIALRLNHNDEPVIKLAFKILAEIGDIDRTRLVMDITIDDAFAYNGWQSGQAEISVLNDTMITRKLNDIYGGVHKVATEAYKRGKYEDALECFDMIYDQRHDRVPGSFLSEYHARLYASSVIKTNREKDDLYIDRVRKEAKRFPKSAWLRIMCGQILLKNNEYVVDAELEFSAAVDMDEKGETTARFWLAESYIKQELFDEAIAIAIEDTKARPKKCDAWGNLGEANAYAGNYEEAYAAFRRALEANPNYTYAQNQLTRIEKILERR